MPKQRSSPGSDLLRQELNALRDALSRDESCSNPRKGKEARTSGYAVTNRLERPRPKPSKKAPI